MKTLLLWGVDTILSQHITYQLSVNGHRLLATGPNFDNLQELDVALCQPELHRFSTALAPRSVAEWVSEQHIGLDGVVLFPPPPEPGTLLTPLTANLRRAERSVYAPVELLRELVPQLRRGKRPKRVLVVLAWDTPSPSVHETSLVNLWQSLVRALVDELEPEGVQLNVLYTCAQAPAATPTASRPVSSSPTRARAEEETSTSERTALIPCDTAVFAAEWFSPALSPLNGQFLHHPNRKVLRAAAPGAPGMPDGSNQER